MYIISHLLRVLVGHLHDQLAVAGEEADAIPHDIFGPHQHDVLRVASGRYGTAPPGDRYSRVKEIQLLQFAGHHIELMEFVLPVVKLLPIV